jgi:hypothetical protein
MASVSTRSFNDPDEYFSGIRAMKGSGFLSSERGVFGAELTHVNFSRLWIQSAARRWRDPGILPSTAIAVRSPS